MELYKIKLHREMTLNFYWCSRCSSSQFAKLKYRRKYWCANCSVWICQTCGDYDLRESNVPNCILCLNNYYYKWGYVLQELRLNS